MNIAWLSLLIEVANSGVAFEDPRIGYVEVQIDRDVWDRIQAVKASVPFSDYPTSKGPMKLA